MRFLLMMHVPNGGPYEMPSWDPHDIDAHLAFMSELKSSLEASGELVDGQALAAPDQAMLISASDEGLPVTDGIFPESKEFLAGYWIVDVDASARAHAIAARVSMAPGKKGAPLHLKIEVREVMTAGCSIEA